MTRRHQRSRLLTRIRRDHQTITETLDIAGLKFHFTRIADPDRVLDQVAAEEDRLEKVSGQRAAEDQLHLPYWAELWESARGIGQWLVRNADILDFRFAICDLNSNRKPKTENPKFLDLGCGMGLAGAVAARLGARVLFADLEPPALLFARLNSLPDKSRVRTRRVDWRSDRLRETFDLILGADILYERKQWDHLEAFWRAHLKPDGAILLGEPGRQTGELFVEWITERGWLLKEHSEKVPTRATSIRIFELRI